MRMETDSSVPRNQQGSACRAREGRVLLIWVDWLCAQDDTQTAEDSNFFAGYSGEDFIPTESQPARVVFNPDNSGPHLHAATGRTGRESHPSGNVTLCRLAPVSWHAAKLRRGNSAFRLKTGRLPTVETGRTRPKPMCAKLIPTRQDGFHGFTCRETHACRVASVALTISA